MPEPSRDHHLIFLLLLIVAIGTPILVGYEASPDKGKRRVALWLVGILAVGATIFAVHFVYRMARLIGFLLETGQLWMGLLAILFPFVIAAGLWWAFCRIRQGKPV